MYASVGFGHSGPLRRKARIVTNPYAPLQSGSYGLSQTYTPRCCPVCDAAQHSPAPDMQIVWHTDAGARCLVVTEVDALANDFRFQNEDTQF
ncbi:hypothetical protein K438DRAFT_1967329 [Mycena galopus ATCC 62051]|nr:hypothetical protein K438DRAFT_1967329 [Mycena galopus ATCC 62051]